MRWPRVGCTVHWGLRGLWDRRIREYGIHGPLPQDLFPCPLARCFFHTPPHSITCSPPAAGTSRPSACPRPRTQCRSPWLGDPPSVACGHTEGGQPVCGPSCSPTCETPHAAQTPGDLGNLKFGKFEIWGVWELQTHCNLVREPHSASSRCRASAHAAQAAQTPGCVRVGEVDTLGL